MTMRSKSALALLAVLCLCGGSAHGHAELERASPPVGGVVARSPGEIRLWFTESLEPRFSRVQLVAPSGATAGSGSVDRQNPSQLVIRAPRLSPGTYRVIWRVISIDTHQTEGAFTFTVGP